MPEFIAHRRSHDQAVQTVEQHLNETADIAKALTDKLNLSQCGELLGLMHDFGKYSQDFQEYIRAMTGVDADADNDYVLPNGKKIDHSTAGAQWVYRALRKFGVQNGIGELAGQMLGLCIASHHGAGLIDCLNPDGEAVWVKRFQKDNALTHLQECEQKADKEILHRANELASEGLIREFLQFIKPLVQQEAFKNNPKIQEFYLGCMTRFLFSCLIDADRINSSDFERENQKSLRRLTEIPNWQHAIEKLEKHLAHFAVKYPIDNIRRNISETCLNRAEDEQGIYTLTVPTGGGKTLASLRYALHHAQKHQLDRIIYIIPYTSIIDQNAQTVRDILGEAWVLEHHSNIEPEKQNWQDKLLSENWDKPIVFTTMVQFLDSWFGGGTRGVRHVHAMSKSVLIFDEIQTLPIKCVHLFANVLNWLNQFGKSTAILCTATQPLLHQLKNPQLGEIQLSPNAELMGDTQKVQQLFADLSRVKIHHKNKAGGWSRDEAGEFLLEQFHATQSVLFIVNTKQWAKELYQYCEQQNIPEEALFHLSTHQCSAHRKALFEAIKCRLKNNQPVICISTQLIEAGVDISFACVIRALGGLDSIAQAAGRCNRHGEQNKGQVFVLNLQEPNFATVLPDIYEGQLCGGRIFREFPANDILNPQVISRYFDYYFYARSHQMTYPVKQNSGDLLDWLSDNACNIYTPKNDKRRPKLPLLMQSFKSAGQAFAVIDAPTQAVIVPYGEGKTLIGQLCGAWNPQAMHRLLSQAQQFSVNVFPSVWKKLIETKAIQEVQLGTGIYYLDERYYNQAYGLTCDESNEMTFYDL